MFQEKMTFNPKIMQLLFKLFIVYLLYSIHLSKSVCFFIHIYFFVEILFRWFICIQYLTFVCPIARACIQLLIDRDLVEMIDPG